MADHINFSLMDNQTKTTCLQYLEAINRSPVSKSPSFNQQDEDPFSVLNSFYPFSENSSNIVQDADGSDLQISDLQPKIASNMSNTQPNMLNIAAAINYQRQVQDPPIAQRRGELIQVPNIANKRSRRSNIKKEENKGRKESQNKNFPSILCSLLKDIQKQTLSKYQKQESISDMFAAYSRLFLDAMIQRRTLKTINRFLFYQNEEKSLKLARQLEELMNKRKRGRNTMISLQDLEDMQRAAREAIMNRKQSLIEAAGRREWDQKHKDLRDEKFVEYVKKAIQKISSGQKIGLRREK